MKMKKKFIKMYLGFLSVYFNVSRKTDFEPITNGMAKIIIPFTGLTSIISPNSKAENIK